MHLNVTIGIESARIRIEKFSTIGYHTLDSYVCQVEEETPMTKTGIVLFIVLLAFAATLPMPAAAEPLTFTRNARGSFEGFHYEFWIQNQGENASMTLTGGGTFECEWSDVFNVLFRMGKRLGSTDTYGEYGDIILEYAAEHEIISGNVSYLCVYGWTENPLIEWYIVENYGNYKPPGGKGYQGTIEVDGAAYEVYVDTRVEQPSIKGTKTFQQYFSVRVDKRTEGTITISDHFKAWEELGLDMSGVLYEVALCVEGFNERSRSGGRANVYRHVLTVGDTVYDGSEAPPPVILEPTPIPSPVMPEESASPEPVPSVPPHTGNVDPADNRRFRIILIVLGVLAVGIPISIDGIRKKMRKSDPK
jgi:hypothetical protein